MSVSAYASSHMDAPLITFDDPANTTDVYAFKTERGSTPYLTTALSVYPFEQPGIGPNKYTFDDDVLYQIHVSLGDDIQNGDPTISYEFEFSTFFANLGTILQVYLGPIDADFVNDPDLNLLQSYTVTKVDHRDNSRTFLGSGHVAPNNQGIATPLYNQNDDGNMPAKDGVDSEANLDPYTANSIEALSGSYRSFAGQREDGFFADIQAVFDLLSLRSGGVANAYDSQSGFNVHTIALEIPITDLRQDPTDLSEDPEMQLVGVFATTSRRAVRILSDGPASPAPRNVRSWVQVGRQGNPLFCEALVGIADKDLYNRTSPADDASLFASYALDPELVTLIDILVFGDLPGGADSGVPDNRLTGRIDIAGIFIPDVIKVDLSTGPARLAGGSNDDVGYSNLGVFGGDTLTSQVQPGFDLGGGTNGTISGGWPNGRRFGDDVIDIAVAALVNDLRTAPVTLDLLGVVTAGNGIDNVNANDAVYNKVFPYAATPHNGRNFEANPNLVR
ncbi:MAG: DUF4331 domain-containing protein [Verrucomicrobiota bacterium]